MAVTKQEVILEFKADTSDVTKNIENVEKSIDKTSDATAGLTSSLDSMTGGAISGFKNTVGQVRNFVTGLKTLKVALAATGIGVLVLALGALVTYFTKSEEGARKLARGMEVVKTVTNVIIDRIGMLGKAIVQVFEGDFSGAANTARNAISGVNEEIREEIELFDDLILREQALEDARIRQTVQTAKTRAEIKELNLVAEDLTKTTEEREAAAFRAGELERALFEERKRLAEEELAIAEARLDNTTSLTKDRQKVAELEAEIFQLAQESLELQTTLNNKLNTIRAEAIRQRQEELDIIIETRDALNENKVLVDEIETQEVDRTLMGQRRQTEIVETESQRRRRIRREESELFRDFVLKDQETMVNASRNGLNLLADLNAAFTGETEAEQKKGFERSKKIQAAQALISTFEATIASYKSVVGTPLVGPILAPIVAAATAAVGLKNVQAIKNQQFQGGGGAPDTGGGGLPNVSARGPQVPTLDLGFLGAGAGQDQPIRAYVLAENVSNSQQANQKIKDQTLIG
jgi:hypothetical protein